MTSFTSITPSVIVPVLSRQITLTLARVSIQYKSCTKTFLLDSLITLTAKTVLVSKTNPSGIIPIRAATVLTTAFSKVLLGKNICLANKSIPKGTITNEIVFTILFKLLIISLDTSLIYLVSLLILAV